MTIKLSDSQLVILSEAASRTTGHVLPVTGTRLNPASITRVMNSLLKKKLIKEIPASAEDERWREDGDRAYTLVITDTGFAALGIDAPDTSARQGIPPTRTTRSSKPASKANSKQDQLLALLKRRKGASRDELISASGWQAHSVRGFLSGRVRRKMGLALEVSDHPKRGRVYTVLTPDQVSS